MHKDGKDDFISQLSRIDKELANHKYIDNYRDYFLVILFYKLLSDRQEAFGDKVSAELNYVPFLEIDDDEKLTVLKKKSMDCLGYFLEPEMIFSQILKSGKVAVEGFDNDFSTFLGVLDWVFMEKEIETFINITKFLDPFSRPQNLPREQLAKFKLEILIEIQNIFSGKEDDKSDVPGELFEAAISFFAQKSNNRDSFNYTTKEVSELVAQLVAANHQNVSEIYDPACGSGSLLLNVCQKLDCKTIKAQEISQKTTYLARMNMLVHELHPSNIDVQIGNVLNNPKHTGEKYEVIVSEPPFLVKHTLDDDLLDERFEPFQKQLLGKKADFCFVLHMLNHLEYNGTLVTVIAQGMLFRGGVEKDVRAYLIEHNLIDAVIGLPANLHQGTAIPLALLILRKNREKGQNILFIDASGEDHYTTSKNKNTLRQSDITKIVDAYKQKTKVPDYCRLISAEELLNNNSNLNVKRYVDSSNAAKELKYLADQYGSFDYVRLETVVESISTINKQHVLTQRDNVVYFPRQAMLKAKSKDDFASAKSKSNYFEIVLDEKVIMNEYFLYFLESDLGQNIIKTQSQGAIIPSITKDDLLNIVKIPLPSLVLQSQVVSAYQLMNRVKSSIESIQKELSLSPNTANSVSEKLHGTLDTLNQLSEEESILANIRKGESKTLEFKESFSLDVRQFENNKKYTPKKEDDIEHSSLKNVVGFINSEGGTLLIGVNDDGVVTGLDNELALFHQKSVDKFLLHFKNKTKQIIGADFYSHFDANIKHVSGKKIMVVECKKSYENPCFYDGKHFFVRTNPATDELSIQEATKYIAEHFKKHK